MSTSDFDIDGAIPDDIPDEVPDEIDEEDDGDQTLTAEDVQDVLLYTLDWSVQSLLERIGRTFNINPAFQRRDAWNAERKSRYIESLMLGLPVPQVVLAEDKDAKGQFIVLDGKQRLVTMKQFGESDQNFPALRLRKMEFLPKLNGKTFEQIKKSADSAEWIENFLAQPVRTIVVRNWRKTAVLYQVFVRLNQGSLPLSPQELRQALFPGTFSSWINARSSASKAIHRARRTKGEDFRMRDAEMLLRGVAFQENIESYDGDLRGFLDAMCETGNADWANSNGRYENHANAVELSIERTELIFGEGQTYFRYNGLDNSYVRRFNIAVFDLMCMVLSSPELTKPILEKHRSALKEGFERLCKDNVEFESALKSTTKTPRATARRIILYGEVVQNTTGIQLHAVERAKDLLNRAAGNSS